MEKPLPSGSSPKLSLPDNPKWHLLRTWYSVGIAFSSVDERGFHFGAQLNLPGDDEGGLIYKLTLPLSAQGNPAIERDTNQDTSASDEVSD